MKYCFIKILFKYIFKYFIAKVLVKVMFWGRVNILNNFLYNMIH